MTTAIPYFFQPVNYYNSLYVDGGLKGHFPIEVCKSKNYLGLNLLGVVWLEKDLQQKIKKFCI